MQSRREFGRLSVAAAALAGSSGFLSSAVKAAEARVPTEFGGVRMGVCLYDFRDVPRNPNQAAYIDYFVDACRQVGAGLVEINSPYLEPVNDLPASGIPRLWDARPVSANTLAASTPAWLKMSPEDLQKQRVMLRNWRLNTPMSYFTGIRRKFESAGLTPFSYVTTFSTDMTDPEIDVMFRQATALGVSIFSTNQTKVEMALRLAPFAERHKIDLGFHNHTAVQNPNEVASLDSFQRLFSVSPRFKANLDVGHYAAANQDALAFVKQFPDRITHLHMKDRKRDNGPGTVWGEGDAPLKEILLYLRDTKSKIPAIVEYEYRGAGSGIVETKRCIDFMRRTLA